MPSPAAAKRYAAINGLTETYCDYICNEYDAENIGEVVVQDRAEYLDAHRYEIAADIRALATLGRTAHWKKAIEAWAVKMETIDFVSLHWAFFQFATMAGWAAE